MNVVGMIVIGMWGILFVCFVGVHKWKAAAFLVSSMALWYYLYCLSFDNGLVHQYRQVKGAANRIAVSVDLKESVVNSLFCNVKDDEVDDLIMNAVIATGGLDGGHVTKEEIDFLNEIASCVKEPENRRKAARILLDLILRRSNDK